MRFIPVTTVEDVVDGSLDEISLREAIAIADEDAVRDVIVFDLVGEEQFSDIILNSVIEIEESVLIFGGFQSSIVAADGARIFEFTDPDGTLELDDINLSGGSSVTGGGAVFSRGDLVLRNVEITGAQSSGPEAKGGAVYTLGSLTIENGTYSNNTVDGVGARGGAVYSVGPIVFEDEGTTFRNNSTLGPNGEGGAIFSESTVSITGALFDGNFTAETGSRGGAVYAANNIDIVDTIFTGNYTLGASAPGGAVFGADLVSIEGGRFEANRTEGDDSRGGAVSGNAVIVAASMRGTPNEQPAVFIGNSTAGDRATGGAIDSNTTAEITRAIFTGNSTAGEDALGGAVHGAEVDIGIDPDPASEAAPVSGNFTTGPGAHGGAFAAETRLDVDGLRVEMNEARGIGAQGGAFYSGGSADIANSVVSNNRAITDDGGALAAVGAVDIDNSTFSDNAASETAGRGGAIFSGETVRLSNRANVSGNEAGGPGGGVAAEGDVFVLDSTVAGNASGERGGGVYTEGALYVLAGTISGNAAAGRGGGAYATESATLANATVASNETSGATSAGGGLFSAGDATVLKSTFTGNLTTGSSAPGGGLFYEGAGTLGGSLLIGNVAAGTSGDDDIGLGASATDADRRGAVLTTADASAQEVFANTSLVGDTGIRAGVVAADEGVGISTVALLPQSGNPALDSGPVGLLDENALAIDLNGDGDLLDEITTDGRGEGFARDVDLQGLGNDGTAFGDLGAVEAADANLVPVLDPLSGTVGEEGAPISFDVLTGLVDPEGDPLSLLGLLEEVTRGEATADTGAGTVSFSPNGEFDSLAAGASETVEISYQITDGNGTATGTIVVTVTGENDAPVAVTDTRQILAGADAATYALVNDSVTDVDEGDDVRIVEIGTPTVDDDPDRTEFGSFTINANGAVLIYDPETAFDDLGEGSDRTLRTTYTVEDSAGARSTADLVIEIVGQDIPNFDPVANPDSLEIDAGATAQLIDALENDTDENGDPLTIDTVGELRQVGGPTQSALGTIGIVTVGGGGDAPETTQLSYDPMGAFAALETGETVTLEADYDISDGAGGTATGVVTITVNGTAEALLDPVVANDTLPGPVEQGESVLIDVLANDTDEDGAPLSLEDVVLRISEPPATGTGSAALTEDGQIVFRGGGDFVGTTTLFYEVFDKNDDPETPVSAATGQVTVTVAEPQENAQGISQGEAQYVAYLYEVALDRDGVIDSDGISFWISQLAAGLSREELAEAFVASTEYEALKESYRAGLDPMPEELAGTDLVDFYYENALGREGDDFGRGFWTGLLQAGAADGFEFGEADLLEAFSLSTENLGALPVVTELEEIEPGVWGIPEDMDMMMG